MAEMDVDARSYEEEMGYVERRDATSWRIKKGFVGNMRVPGIFYVDSALESLVFDELRTYTAARGYGGFLPAMKQIANVAALPGIVKASIGLPDIHSGYGFAIGNVAAFDCGDPEAVVSPGGVGFDINCGVRVLRTNLTEADVAPKREELAQSLFDHIPVGVGSKGVIPTSEANLDAALEMGMDWSLREGYSWTEDKSHCMYPTICSLGNPSSAQVKNMAGCWKRIHRRCQDGRRSEVFRRWERWVPGTITPRSRSSMKFLMDSPRGRWGLARSVKLWS